LLPLLHWALAGSTWALLLPLALTALLLLPVRLLR
jgi:hypothetical protein